MCSPGLRWSSTSGTSPSTAIPGSSTSISARSGTRSTVPSTGPRWRRCGAWVTGYEMTRWATLPIRYRLSITFGASVAVVVAGLSIFVYLQTASNLLATVDASLTSRAELLATNARDDGPAQVSVEHRPVTAACPAGGPAVAPGHVLRPDGSRHRQREPGSCRAGGRPPWPADRRGRRLAAGPAQRTRPARRHARRGRGGRPDPHLAGGLAGPCRRAAAGRADEKAGRGYLGRRSGAQAVAGRWQG